MSYSASAYSRVDKAWPKMSESTEERIKRLREMEQRRLEKLELLSKRTSEPVPMPKFVSRISSSRQQNSYENVDKDNATTSKSSDEESERLSAKGTETITETIVTGRVVSKKDSVETKVEKVPAETTERRPRYSGYQRELRNNEAKLTLEDSGTKIDLENPNTKEVESKIQTVPVTDIYSNAADRRTRYSSYQRESRSTETKPTSGDSERNTDSENIKTKTLLGERESKVDIESQKASSSSLSHSLHQETYSPEESNKNNSSNSGDISTIAPVESFRTLSTSFVEGPVSPTSTEKTRISVVRKMKLESLPPVIKNVSQDTSTSGAESRIDGKSELKSSNDNTKSDITTENSEQGLVYDNNQQDKTVSSSLSANPSSVTETKTVSNITNPVSGTVKNRTTSILRRDRNTTSDSGTSQHGETPKSNTDNAISSTTDSKESVFRLETFAMKKELELKAKIDEKFSSDENRTHLAKLEELQKKREERRKILENEEKEDLSELPVRERFFRTQSVGRITRPVRQQSIPEQIRASRLSRRTAEQASRTGSPGKAAEAESPPLTRRSRLQQRSVDRLRRRTIDSVPVLPSSSEERPKPKPVIDLDSIDKAFSRPDQERLSRLDELDRLRIQSKEYMKRRDSAPLLSNTAAVGSQRLDFPSSLVVHRGSCENIARYPIHENLESNFHSSRLTSTNTDDVASRAREVLRSVSIDRPASSYSDVARPILRPSYSESRLFPLDGGRLSHSGILTSTREPGNLEQTLAPSGVLTFSTETEHTQLEQGTNQHQSIVDENDDTPVYMEGSPQGTPLIDNEGKTHWVGPTSPRLRTYMKIMDRLENRNRSSSFDSSFGYTMSHKPKINPLTNLLDPINHDHYLAECFDKKYNLKERCAMIREKLYGEDNKADERGKPDGASHDVDILKSTVDNSK